MVKTTSRRIAPKAAPALAAARRIEPELVATRRQIHAHPELGFEETETSKLVRGRLGQLGLKNRVLATTGVAALVPGRAPGKVLMVRCDMDALPIHEETGLPFGSKLAGKMHACGHDMHTAILLGTARLLAEAPPTKGTIKLNFQPAEEGLNGAHAMVKAGIMEGPKVEAALGYHIWQGIPVGRVAVLTGPCMAAVDKFTIRIHGVGGHAAYPHKAVDPVMIAAQVVTTLQSIVARTVNPLDPVVVTVASIHGGTAFNIIPPLVEMEGTVRTFSKEARRDVPGRMKAIITQVTRALGGRAELEYQKEHPAVVNDAALADFMREVSAEVVGRKNVVETEPSMGGEDMAFYQEMVPGCYIFIGSAPKGPVYPHHHPKFNPDERVLTIATAIMSEAARRWVETR